MITRYRGDTHPQKITLSMRGSVVDLSTVSKVEMGIKKGQEVLVITCEQDADDSSGIVYANFNNDELDTVGQFSFDVQVTWLDNTKTTFVVDKFKIVDDVNKT